MKKIGPMIVMAAALAPAAAFGGTSTTVADNAAKQCSVLRTQIGMSAFTKNFSTFGLCVSQLTPLARESLAAARASCRGSSAFARCLVTFQKNVSLRAASTAAATCRNEQLAAGFAAAHGGRTFAEFYGTNANGKNAFGRCVSTKATASQSSQPSLTPSQQQPTPSTSLESPGTTGGECGGNTDKGGIPKPMRDSECTVASPVSSPN